MRLPSVPSLQLVDHLNTTYFNRLWNATDDHGRANFRLRKAAQRLQVGAVSVNQSVVGLPTTDQVYAVYSTFYSYFGRFITMTENTWMTDVDLFNLYGVSVTAYTSTSRMIPFGTVSFKYDPLYESVLVAIRSVYTTQCTGETYPDIYLTVYKDTTRNTPIVNSLYQISTTFGSTSTPALVTTAIANARTSCPHGTTISVNGFVYDPLHVPTLVVGDIVQINSDPDIVGYYDAIVDDSVTGYYSTMYGEYREVLHIPKSLNPSNIIITNDTVDILIFDVVTNRGLNGNRVNAHAIESITHNDFSISRTSLQDYENTLGASSVKVRMYVRYPTNPIYLTDDVNHISDLYSLSDSEISKQLVSLSSQQIPEWSASHLEQSEFLTLLYQFRGFSTTTALGHFVNAMGYYDVGSVLSDSTRYYSYVGGAETISKPDRLFGYECDAIVYCNGDKVPEASVVISNYSDSQFLLSFTNTYIPAGARVSLYITEKASRTPVIYRPTSSAPSITMDNEDYSLVEIINYGTPKSVWNATTSKGYKIYTPNLADYTLTKNPNGTATYQVRPVHYGSSFYLVPKYGMNTDQYSLDAFLTSNKPIIIDLKATDSESSIVPLMDYSTIEIYINGKRLIENIDYAISITLGDTNDVLQTLLLVSNQEYLNVGSSGNMLEVVTHGDVVVSKDAGYAISNVMHRTYTPTLWSKSSGRVFVRGKLIELINQSGNILTSSDSLVDGSPYDLTYTVPYGVSKLLSSFTPADDNNLQTRIDHVLGIIPPTYPSTVLISDQYSLYSPFLAQVVSDVSSGTFVIADEPKDDAFLRQFLKYHTLSASDPTIGASNIKIDRRFVTLAAHYVNLGTLTPTQMILTQRLINLVLTPSPLSIVEVLL
jgi:hypothetical protein